MSRCDSWAYTQPANCSPACMGRYTWLNEAEHFCMSIVAHSAPRTSYQRTQSPTFEYIGGRRVEAILETMTTTCYLEHEQRIGQDGSHTNKHMESRACTECCIFSSISWAGLVKRSNIFEMELSSLRGSPVKETMLLAKPQ